MVPAARYAGMTTAMRGRLAAAMVLALEARRNFLHAWEASRIAPKTGNLAETEFWRGNGQRL
jgi:hypothetical protein